MFRGFSLLFLLVATYASGQSTWTLQRCVDKAYQNNISIQQGYLSNQVAEINTDAAFWSMMPNLNGSATHGYNWGQTIDRFTNQFATERIRSNSFGLQTGIVLFNGFQLRNSYEQSKINLEKSEADLLKVKNDVALNVVVAYLNLLLTREFLAVAESTRDATSTQVSRIEKLVNAGALPQGSLDEINAQLASDEANMISTRNNVDLAKLSLTQLLLLTPEEAAGFDVTVPEIEDVSGIQLPPDAQAALAYALTSFPEIKSADAAVESAQLGVDIARGGQYPTLSASFSYGTGYSGAAKQPVGDPVLSDPFPIGYTQDTFIPVLSQQFTYTDYETIPFEQQVENNVNQSLFFSLQIPIFNGLSTNSNIQRSRINAMNAEYQSQLVRQQLTQ
ncbi:MAG: TolC family protein, partial [Flavobacteriales bacterium]|nr:TolC family protein [Flavobacteriales bacterium]